MNEAYKRSAMLWGEERWKRLSKVRVAVFGIGGVGGFAAEALARSGIGAIDLIDPDTVADSNVNRQLVALCSTVGRLKVDVMAERIAEINPDCRVTRWPLFYLPDTADRIDLSVYDYVIDAVDTVGAKIELAVRCAAAGVPLVSCMGTGNKQDPTQIEVADLSKTSVCPLAKVMRTELRKRGIEHLTVVYSREQPQKCVVEDHGRHAPASAVFVPGAAGLALAAVATKALLDA